MLTASSPVCDVARHYIFTVLISQFLECRNFVVAFSSGCILAMCIAVCIQCSVNACTFTDFVVAIVMGKLKFCVFNLMT